MESGVGKEVPICSALSLSLLRPQLDTGASLGLPVQEGLNIPDLL